MRAPDNETLVMTATFHAPATPILAVRDERERTRQYLCALVAWAAVSRVQRIVFVENSQTRFDFTPVVRFVEATGKQLELLVFDGNQQAASAGKGFGEGVILEHMFANSQLLQAAPSFYKVTGRLFVANFDELSAATPGPDAFRLRPSKNGGPPKAVTSLFKCSRQLFATRLIDAYKQVNDEPGHRIEQAYFHRLSDLGLPDFGKRPVIVGQHASTGKMYEPYDEGVIKLAETFL